MHVELPLPREKEHIGKASSPIFTLELKQEFSKFDITVT